MDIIRVGKFQIHSVCIVGWMRMILIFVREHIMRGEELVKDLYRNT